MFATYEKSEKSMREESGKLPLNLRLPVFFLILKVLVVLEQLIDANRIEQSNIKQNRYRARKQLQMKQRLEKNQNETTRHRYGSKIRARRKF